MTWRIAALLSMRGIYNTEAKKERQITDGRYQVERDGQIDFTWSPDSKWIAMSIVFTSTLVGFAAKQRMQAHGVNHFLIFIISAFMASLCASAALRFDCSAETALATSVLFLVPGVPLINGVIDIVEGHILIGCSRLINALLLIICIAIGLSATLLMVKDGLL